MNIINYKQQWDGFKKDLFIIINESNVMANFEIEYSGEYIKLQDIYVQPEYRNNGLMHVIMNYVISLNIEDMYLQVKKDSFVVKVYESYGFEFHENCKERDGYIWMVR